MGVRLGGFLSFSILSFYGFIAEVRADDAKVLPQGRFRIRYAGTYSQASNEMSPQGNVQSLGSSYSKPITGGLLKALSSNPQLKQVFAAAPSLEKELITSLNADVKATFWSQIFCLEYGVTDRLSVGLIMPMVHADVEVSATSTANTNLSKKYGPQLAAALQGATTTESINSLLQNQYRYTNALKSWSSNGLGDLELGGKFNYFRDPQLMMTFKTGVRFPTGRTDDPNNLVDVGFGDGQFDLGAYNYVDYSPLGFLGFTWEAGYVYQFADSDNYRVPLSADLPVGKEAIELKRKLGDYFETGMEANITPFRLVTLSGKYRFKYKMKDSYTGGPGGLDLSLLENDTNQVLHEVQTQIEYSNLPRVRAGEDRFPYAIAFLYHQPIAGENISDVRTMGVQLKTYF